MKKQIRSRRKLGKRILPKTAWPVLRDPMVRLRKLRMSVDIDLALATGEMVITALDHHYKPAKETIITDSEIKEFLCRATLTVGKDDVDSMFKLAEQFGWEPHIAIGLGINMKRFREEVEAARKD